MCRDNVKHVRGTAFPTFFFCLALRQASLGRVSAAPSFNRTEFTVRVGSCEGLKTNVELGLDVDISVTSNLACSSTIQLSEGQDVTIAAETPGYFVVVAEDFNVVDSSSASLLINPSDASLSLRGLGFISEAGGQAGVRAIRNAGRLHVESCTFSSLGTDSVLDGGAIYNFGEADTADSGLLIISNSTFTGNVAKDYGGAISAWGQGSIEIHNSTFYSNEAVGMSLDRRSGSGGAIYAAPGTQVEVTNSTFEGCLARYGGAALFLCGGEISDSTFSRNEAEGLFGAVVNGDLSDEQRENASVALGTPTGETFACPLLRISGSSFSENVASKGYGGSVASVDAPLWMFNSTLLETTGGALYFGTSDQEEDQLDLERIAFYDNQGSDYGGDAVGSAFLIEQTGLPIGNATDENASDAESSAVVQAQGSPPILVGRAVDLFCFQNTPYECEGYLAQATLTLTGTTRCNTCEGDAFTGIGTPGGAPTPAPASFTDDDGLSQMGQERAQGGTPAPTPVDFLGSSSSRSDENAGSVRNAMDGDDPALLGATGNMRWVVLGLLAALGASLLVCMSVIFVCRGSSRRRKAGVVRRRNQEKTGGEQELGPAARVGPSSRVSGASPEGPAPSYSLPTTSNALFAASSPGRVPAKKGAPDSSLGTPVSSRKPRDVARQRVMKRSEAADARAERAFWASRGGWATSGPGAIPASPSSRSSLGSMKGGFSVLPDAEGEYGSERSRPSGSTLTSRGRSASQSASTSRSTSKSRRGSRLEDLARGDEAHSTSPDRRLSRPRAIKTPAGGARLPITSTSRNVSPSWSPRGNSSSTLPSPALAAAAAAAAAAVPPPVWAMRPLGSADGMEVDVDSSYMTESPGLSSGQSRHSALRRSGASSRSFGSDNSSWTSDARYF